MAFGGGAFGGGGGAWGGHHGQPGTPQAGLPFAGIPPEMLAGVQKLVADEPVHPEPRIDFSYKHVERERFTLLRFLRPNRLGIALGILLVVLETATIQVGPILTQRAIDKGILGGDFGIVLAMGLLYLASIAANTVVGYYRIRYTGRLGQCLMYRLRVRVFSHIQRLSLDYFTDEKAGRIMTRMTSDIEALAELLQDGVINLAVQLFTLIFVVAALFWMDARLAVIVLVAVVPVMTLMTLWFRFASSKAYTKVRDRIAEVMADLQESLSGIRIVAAYNRQPYNVARHRDIVGDHLEANVESARVAAIFGPGSDFVGSAATALVLLLGGHMVLRDQLSVGELTAFVLYLSSFFAPIQQLVQLYNTYQSGQAAIVKLGDLFATAPSVVEADDAVDLPPIHGDIRLEAVSFGYRPDRPVLTDVNLNIAAGETFALVGPTGGGKSTIAKLITRFYDPTAGRVLVDGHDLRDVTLASLRRQLGVVPQEPFLFGGSIRDNLTFARPDATDDEVLDACRAVGLADLIERLPQGIHTPVFERGSSLSSGERQLLALARAFIAQPRVLVLDEATSSLDLRSEAMVDAALAVVLEGRTAVVIAHRLSTAMQADRIGVVVDGRIAELGSHAELVERGGIYAEMFATWQSHLADPVG